MKFPFLLVAWLAAFSLLPAQTPPPQPVAFRIGSVRFDRPDGWNYSRPADGIRAAQLEKKSAGGPLLITFTRFPPGSGGSVQANLDRWISQFQSAETPPEILKPDATALPLTLVKITGTLRGGTPGGPARDSPGTLLLGAILESPEGLVVAKLAGPRASVAREEKIFSDLVRAAAGRAP
jgi:hypothetical protein